MAQRHKHGMACHARNASTRTTALNGISAESCVESVASRPARTCLLVTRCAAARPGSSDVTSPISNRWTRNGHGFEANVAERRDMEVHSSRSIMSLAPHVCFGLSASCSRHYWTDKESASPNPDEQRHVECHRTTCRCQQCQQGFKPFETGAATRASHEDDINVLGERFGLEANV